MTSIPQSDAPALEVIAQPPPPVHQSRWQKFLHWKFWHWQYAGLLIIVVFTLAFHFAAISRPSSIVWDEKWYVGDARSILTNGGDVRPEHPPLAKLFIAAGDYIFSGFKVPLKNTGATLQYPIGNSTDNLIYVGNASLFHTGTTIMIDREQLNVTAIDTKLNTLTVERDSGGTGTGYHALNAPIYVFTDHAFGWRFFSVIFGTLGIIIFFFICRKLRLSLRTTLIATFLFALDDMTFLHSGLALLDVFMVTFMLAAILTYLDENYLFTGIFVALSAQCKLTGLLVVIALALHFLIYRRKKWLIFISSFVLSGAFYVLLIILLDFFITGRLEDPVVRIHSMFSGTAAVQFTIPKLSISSYPWTWIYPQFVQVYYNSPNVPFIIYSFDPQYVSFISSTIQILILPTIGYMIYKAVKGSETGAFIALWFFAMYLLWIPMTIFTNRVTFVYYFLAATPAICIGIATAINDLLVWLKGRRELAGRVSGGVKTWYAVIGFYLLVHLAIFIVFNPAIPTLIKTWLPPFNAH